MDRDEALNKIAWHQVKQLTREQAIEIVTAFFHEPLKPSLREKLNITAVLQWETHNPPENLNPGNPIYRPILIDRMRRPFIGTTNTYLADYLRNHLGLNVAEINGTPATLLPCPVCGYHTFVERGTWKHCPVCGWNSDPMQEALPTEAIGANGISMNDARANFAEFGAITRDKIKDVDPDGPKKFPRG